MKTLAEQISSMDTFSKRVMEVEMSHGETVRLVYNQRTGGSMVIVGKGTTLVCDDPGYRYNDTLITVDEINSIDQLN